MRVHNLRFGLATNSSSSHSIILDRSLKNVRDDYDDFGWSFFTCASKEAKDDYMSAMLAQNLRDMPMDLITAILAGLGLPRRRVGEYGMLDLTIDHQSLYRLPVEFGATALSVQFFKEFREYVLRDGIVILGGNDNSDHEHPLYKEDVEVTFDKWYSEGDQMICRKDGDWWTLFNPQNGARAIFSFEDAPKSLELKSPMLADIKITDFCTAGCAYCYQGSTPSGAHADRELLRRLAYDLGDSQVFEVAIGGGEPTEHPHFEEFLSTLRAQGVVPNFTTRSIRWMENETLASKIMKHAGAIAFSADGHNIHDLKRAIDIFKYRNYGMSSLNVQIIPAILNEYTFKEILKLASEDNLRVTLLGYKDSGRGGKFKDRIITRQSHEFFNEDKWLDILKDLNDKRGEPGGFWLPTISIDTTLAATHLEKLKAAGIPEWLYHTQEGKYSMYFDMVGSTFGPSSYHQDLLQPLGNLKKSTKYPREMNTVEEAYSLIAPV